MLSKGEKPPAINPLRFAANRIPDWPTECQPVSWCQIPSGNKLQSNPYCRTVGCIAAWFVFARRNIFAVIIWHVKKFRSSETLKSNYLKQARCFWTKNVSEKGEKLSRTFITEINSSIYSRLKLAWEICVCSTRFIARVLRRQEVEKIPCTFIIAIIKIISEIKSGKRWF